MSWPQWTSTAQPALPSVLNPSTPVINSAPPVAPPGLQYTPDQWAQLQQQNWNQWAQWQQQYQQWHQQYGAEYQKSINALAQAAQQQVPGLPNVTVPPPLPAEVKPPLPTEDPPPHTPSYSTAPLSNQLPGYNTTPAPPPRGNERPMDNNPKPNQSQNWQAQGRRYQPDIHSNKRSYDQPSGVDAKRPMLSKPNWQNHPPPLVAQQPTRPVKENIEELSEAEKKFDKQFADWEAQFIKWKEQNAEHPDKEQYREYEKKWESWRAQLLERREQMKRKRLGLLGESPSRSRPGSGLALSQSSQQNYNSPQQQFGQNQLSNVQPVPKPTQPFPTAPTSFNKPPPNLNDEPLNFKETKLPIEEDQGNVGDFIKPNIGGGIPGLDLVKDDPQQKNEGDGEVEIDAEPEKKGPDFDAISKGINTILGDQKLLNMLSMVSQTPNSKMNDHLTNTVSRINADGSQVPYDQSNLSYEEHSNQSEVHAQREFVTNFDDQTRSSFTMGHNEQEGRYDMPGSFGRNQKFDQNEFSNRFGNRFAGPENDHYRAGIGRNEFTNERQFGPRPDSPDRFLSKGERFPGGDRYASHDRGFGAPRNDLNKDRLPPNQGRFGQERPGSGYENFGPPQDRFDQNQDRFVQGQNRFGNNQGTFGTNDRFDSTEDRFGPAQDKFQPNQDRFGHNQNRGGPNRDNRYGQNQNRFGQNQERFGQGPNEDKFGPYQDKFAANHGRFGEDEDGLRSNQEKFGGSQERLRWDDRDRFGPNQDRFGPDRQFGYRNDFRQNLSDNNFARNNEGDFDPRDGRNDNFRGGDIFDEGNYDDYQEDEPFEEDYDDSYDYNQEAEKYENEEDPNIFQDTNIKESHEEETNRQEIPGGGVQPEVSVPASKPVEILQPTTVIDYDHKSIKSAEGEVLIEPIYMFDYRHKALSRIPLPQRPKWLSETVKNIREFDPPLVRPYEPPNLRRYPPVDNWKKDRYSDDNWTPHNRRNYNEKRFEDRRSYDDGKSYDEGPKQWNPVDNRRREEYKKPVNDDTRSYPSDKKQTTAPREYEEEKISDTEWQDDDDDGEPPDEQKSSVDFTQFQKPDSANKTTRTKSAVLIEDLICSPGRYKRPPRIVIILRGPPGSGKTFLAKLIKDKEVENGGSPPRILSLDDYFMVDQEKEVIEEGKKVKIKEMVYEYEAEMEESYRTSLIKSFKKTITDGYFSFIIVDNVNDKVKYFGEMWSFAKQNGFQVYICQLDLDVQTCIKRNIHGRSEAEIEKSIAGWEPTPSHHPVLDATNLLQSASIPEVEMEEVNSPESDANEHNAPEDQVARSKWDNFDCSVDNLAKLDGVSKPLRASRTMEEYLQLDTEWTPNKPTKPGQKRVRWADLEEQKQQEKMRAIGFVVGQTNWSRMLDPTMGSSALTQTKYIERTGRYKVDPK